MSNLRIWDALGRTDPAQTKGFKRSGGFSGTAIKPMWSNLRMTELFGPAGIGWGPKRPTFETHLAGEEMLVFCTVGLWYVDPSTSTRGTVFGVGGDKFLIKQKDGLRASDEAFKAAYTDAMGNAMKLIGVAADIHMGLFDDSKYVAAMHQEFHPVTQDKKPVAIPPQPPVSLPTWEYTEDMLTCQPIDVDKRENKQGALFMAVKLNGKCEGKNMAFCWHAGLFEAIDKSKGMPAVFRVEFARDFLNIIDVLKVGDQDYFDGKPTTFVPLEVPSEVMEMLEETVP